MNTGVSLMDMNVSLMNMEASLAVEMLVIVFILLFLLIFVKFEVSVLKIIWDHSDPYRKIDNAIIFFGIQSILCFALVILINRYILKQYGMGDISPQISVIEDADTTEIIEDKESHDTETTEGR